MTATLTPRQAERLAVAYHAYLTADAATEADNKGLWASLLLAAQNETGVELMPTNLLERTIALV